MISQLCDSVSMKLYGLDTTLVRLPRLFVGSGDERVLDCDSSYGRHGKCLKISENPSVCVSCVRYPIENRLITFHVSYVIRI